MSAFGTAFLRERRRNLSRHCFARTIKTLALALPVLAILVYAIDSTAVARPKRVSPVSSDLASEAKPVHEHEKKHPEPTESSSEEDDDDLPEQTLPTTTKTLLEQHPSTKATSDDDGSEPDVTDVAVEESPVAEVVDKENKEHTESDASNEDEKDVVVDNDAPKSRHDRGPLLFILPYTAQLNAASTRYAELLHLLKSVKATDRALLEPLVWSAPFDDKEFEKKLKKIGIRESEKFARSYKDRKQLMKGEIFEGIGKYFEADRISKWVGMPIIPYDSFEEGTTIEIDMLLAFCDRIPLEYYNNKIFYNVTNKITLHILNKTCIDQSFGDTCHLPPATQYRNVAVVPLATGSYPFHCATGPKREGENMYGLMARRDVWLNEARQHLKWHPRLYALADQFRTDRIPKGKFIAAHWRRGDKLIEEVFARMTPKYLAKRLNRLITRSGGTKVIKSVFLATNSGSEDDIRELRKRLWVPVVMYPSADDWRESVDHSIVEQILCVEAEWFLGAPYSWHVTSAFTRMVMDARTLVGKEKRSIYQK
mmetsp:Transcript_9794/g.16069  ORF Transcript_9794/g.16069 Transcript_9794/m.16069 type:complete len:538 (+) Transcript_9794:213-1826(+)|eukprot:CAMPEP_0184650088 /NCGR_PEP_ID=MMETSP0308-20130426/7577_1 /TAXON_ID=38269 /ORGANISM="Gloeochaete witrockiana, Strain SAG 46.84" /LENGTH=537 /DNA_ID=CAMNT_0027083357 /DNA_START=139 /DNA_END=1752 /DNA_ORIENTATION=+